MKRDSENGDRLYVCCEPSCGSDFLLEVGEIQYYLSRGLQLPKRCKACRQAKKERNAQRYRAHDGLTA